MQPYISILSNNIYKDGANNLLTQQSFIITLKTNLFAHQNEQNELLCINILLKHNSGDSGFLSSIVGCYVALAVVKKSSSRVYVVVVGGKNSSSVGECMCK